MDCEERLRLAEETIETAADALCADSIEMQDGPAMPSDQFAFELLNSYLQLKEGA